MSYRSAVASHFSLEISPQNNFSRTPFSFRWMIAIPVDEHLVKYIIYIFHNQVICVIMIM